MLIRPLKLPKRSLDTENVWTLLDQVGPLSQVTKRPEFAGLWTKLATWTPGPPGPLDHLNPWTTWTSRALGPKDHSRPPGPLDPWTTWTPGPPGPPPYLYPLTTWTPGPLWPWTSGPPGPWDPWTPLGSWIHWTTLLSRLESHFCCVAPK